MSLDGLWRSQAFQDAEKFRGQALRRTRESSERGYPAHTGIRDARAARDARRSDRFYSRAAARAGAHDASHDDDHNLHRADRARLCPRYDDHRHDHAHHDGDHDANDYDVNDNHDVRLDDVIEHHDAAGHGPDNDVVDHDDQRKHIR